MLRYQQSDVDSTTRRKAIVSLLRCDDCDYEWRVGGLVALLCPVCGSTEVAKKEDLGLDLV